MKSDVILELLTKVVFILLISKSTEANDVLNLPHGTPSTIALPSVTQSPPTTSSFVIPLGTDKPPTATVIVPQTTTNVQVITNPANSNPWPMTSLPNTFGLPSTSTVQVFTTSHDYYGYTLLEDKVGDDSKISESDVEDWLKKRTRSECRVSNLEQQKKTMRRRRRQTDKEIHISYEVVSNSTEFYRNFKKSENISSSIRNHSVKKAILQQKNTQECSDGKVCSDGHCLLDGYGNSYCSAAAAPFNPLGLIAIPCIVVFIAVVALIAYFVHKQRRRKQQQDITKIHPASYETLERDREDSISGKPNEVYSLDGFNSVKSSNFEYDYENKVTGLY